MAVDEIQDEYLDWVDDDTDYTEDFSDKLNALFTRMLRNPSDRGMSDFQTARDVLIAAFLAGLIDKLETQLKQSMNMGIDVANGQIKRLKIDKIVKKTINDKKFKDMLDSVVESNKTTLAYVLNGVKVNTDNIIKDIKSNVTVTKKVISTELAAQFQKNGITEFQDRAGRRIAINNYIKQKSLDEITRIMRKSYFMQAIKYGVPYVRIVHLNIHPSCPLCAVFEGKILAIQENDKGVMTIAEADSQGLWHFSCDHVPMAMELTNDFTDKEIDIKLTDKNKKFEDYYKRKGMKFNL